MSGVVLAGGASRRMGVDKATIVVEGETLLARAARRLREAGADPVAVATGAAGRLGPLPFPELDDGAYPGAGPLAGILAALRHSPTPVVAVLAVDVVDASPELFHWLRREWRSGDDLALVPVDAEGRSQHLHALYGIVAAEAIARQLDAGERRVWRLLDTVGARRLTPPPDLAAGAWWTNRNQPGRRSD